MWSPGKLLLMTSQANLQLADEASGIASDVKMECAIATLHWSVAVQSPADLAKVNPQHPGSLQPHAVALDSPPKLD
jgi:hypothetical protein